MQHTINIASKYGQVRLVAHEDGTVILPNSDRGLQKDTTHEYQRIEVPHLYGTAIVHVYDDSSVYVLRTSKRTHKIATNVTLPKLSWYRGIVKPIIKESAGKVSCSKRINKQAPIYRWVFVSWYGYPMPCRLLFWAIDMCARKPRREFLGCGCIVFLKQFFIRMKGKKNEST